MRRGESRPAVGVGARADAGAAVGRDDALGAAAGRRASGSGARTTARFAGFRRGRATRRGSIAFSSRRSSWTASRRARVARLRHSRSPRASTRPSWWLASRSSRVPLRRALSFADASCFSSRDSPWLMRRTYWRSSGGSSSSMRWTVLFALPRNAVMRRRVFGVAMLTSSYKRETSHLRARSMPRDPAACARTTASDWGKARRAAKRPEKRPSCAPGKRSAQRAAGERSSLKPAKRAQAKRAASRRRAEFIQAGLRRA